MSEITDHSRVTRQVDVLCVGAATVDLVFSVSSHPGPDEKSVATAFLSCGGGPAANAAVTVARLGGRSAFAGYLGNDGHGQMHLDELVQAGVDTSTIQRGEHPTPISAILVKRDGNRTVVNYPGHGPLAAGSVSFSSLKVGVVLLDGHQPWLAKDALLLARRSKIPTILDAGSVTEGTLSLSSSVDYLVAAHKFAHEFTGTADAAAAVAALAKLVPAAAVTLGEEGLVWQRGGVAGRIGAMKVAVVDTTAAGDVFHGAFALAIARGAPWLEALEFANCVAGASCRQMGGRTGIPTSDEAAPFLAAAGITFPDGG